jgi:hypothetical protein
VKFLSPEILLESSIPYPESYDHVLHRNMTITRGGWGLYPVKSLNMVGWCGYGGSLMQWDSSSRIAIGYVPNGMLSMVADQRARKLLSEVSKIINKRRKE